MNKISNKNKILRGIKAMVIVAVIILSTAAVTTATSISSTSMNIEKKAESGMETLSDVLLQEGFEDGVMPPPDGWSTIDNNPTYNWDIIDADDPVWPGSVHSGQYAAWIERDLSNPSDEWLISPEIELTDAYDSISLDFWCRALSDGSGDATITLHIMGEGFDDVIWNLREDEDWNAFDYRNKTFDLLSYQGETIQISWQKIGLKGWWFALDDVFLSGEGGAESNISIGDVKGGLVQVSAEIKNDGDADANDVEYSIKVTGGIFNRINVTTTGTIETLAAGTSETKTTDEPIWGLGNILIVVEANEPFGSGDNETANGFVLIIFVKV